MAQLETLRARRDELLRIAHAHGASNVRVFGSVARGDEGDDSDVDFLVALEDGRSLFDLVRLYDAFEAALGRSVDIVTDGGISPYLREHVLAEAVAL